MAREAARGAARERKVRKHLEETGWWVSRAAGSLGDADLIACRNTARPNSKMRQPLLWLVEVKANVEGGPYKNFGPAERQQLSEAAKLAGAEAVLAHWPAHGNLTLYFESVWPSPAGSSDTEPS